MGFWWSTPSLVSNFAFSKQLWEGSSLPVGISQDEIPPSSFQMTLSFSLANFPFDLNSPWFPSHDLPHLRWRALTTWFGFSLLSVLTVNFLSEICWESAKSSCAWALPCCQITLLKAISSCRQQATGTPLEGCYAPFMKCALSSCHTTSHYHSGRYIFLRKLWMEETGGLVSESFVLCVSPRHISCLLCIAWTTELIHHRRESGLDFFTYRYEMLLFLNSSTQNYPMSGFFCHYDYFCLNPTIA